MKHVKTCPHDCSACKMNGKIRDGSTHETAILFCCKTCNKMLDMNWCCGVAAIDIQTGRFYAWRYGYGTINVAYYDNSMQNKWGSNWHAYKSYDMNSYLKDIS